MMNSFLLLLLLLLSSAHLLLNGAEIHLNVKRSPANPRPNVVVREEVNGISGSSTLLDPKFTVDLSKEEVVWEWKKWNSTKSVDILDHFPSKSPMVPGEQFKRRLEFNISNGVLTITPLESRDQGTYIVYVQGEKKKELHLRVYEKLSDASILANSSSLGLTIQLTCNVTGGDPEYQWWYNGGEILEHHQLMDGNRTLIIKVASACDSGNFTCEATNPVSSVRANYTLTVPEKLSDALILANSSSLGSTIQLTCNVTGGDPEYQWWYNGGEILEHHQLMDGNRTLIIKVASACDSGNFACEATNPVSSVRANYTLTVPGFLPKTTAIPLFITELVVSLCRIVPVLLCCCKMKMCKALKNKKYLLGLNLIDILLLVGIFIDFIYFIMHKDVTIISALILCAISAQLLALILSFVILNLSCPSVECLQKILGAWNWILYIVVVITSITFFVIYGNNSQCDSSLETWVIFFSARILNVVIFFLPIVAQCWRDKRRRENGSTVKGEQDTGELQELKLSAPDHPGEE